MSYTHHIKGECEAFRLLRAIVSGTEEEVFLAKSAACRLLNGMREPRNALAVGVRRANVAHHLRPSKAMLAAMLAKAA